MATDIYDGARTLGEIFEREAAAKAAAARTAQEKALQSVRDLLEWLALDAQPTMAPGDAEDLVDEIIVEIQARLLGIVAPTSKTETKSQGAQDVATEGSET